MKRICYLLCLVISYQAVCLADDARTGMAKLEAIDDSISLDEVVVTGTRIPVARDLMPIPVSIVGRQTIERSGESMLMPTLAREVPGLFVTARGMEGYGVSSGAAGGINLRGFGGGEGRLLILIDGHPQYAAIYGHPVADAYIASDAERVEVSHGAASVLYGSNAMGGAINIITRKIQHEGNRLQARLEGGSYGTQKYSLNDSYKNGRFTAYIGGGFVKTDGHRANSAFNSLNGMGKAAYELTDEWKLTANMNLTKFEAENPGTEGTPMLEGVVDVVRGMTGLSLENVYGKTRGAANFYYNWGNHAINDGYTAGGKPQPYLFHSTDYMGGVNLYQAVNPFEGNSVTGGFDVKLYGGNAYRNPETEVYADHIKLHEIAGYLFVQQRLSHLMLNAGLRLENHNLYGSKWIPQAGLSYKPVDNTSLKLSVSRGFRTPNMRELYMYAPANEELKPESSLSYDFSVNQRLAHNRLNLTLNLFYTKGDNIVQVVMVEGRPQNQNVGEFANKGVEFGMSWMISNTVSLTGNYNRLSMDTPLTGAPRQKIYAGVSFTPSVFAFNLGLTNISDLYLATGSAAQTTDFTLLNARAGYHVTKWAELFVKADNLLGSKYETMLGFPMPGATFTAGVGIRF
ncbi:MAG: TonB-dependent receptor [Tannerella sp.]|jgi:iron complex outermembrane receptor protein|nr:TonB-dependent receptor [Tannerella sp.]